MPRPLIARRSLHTGALLGRGSRAAEFRLRSWRQMQALLHDRREVQDPVVTHHEVHLQRLPPELDRMRIVHLSDIHYGLFLSPRTLLRVLDLTSAQKPDLIALTGDFVTQSPAFIEPVGELIGRLRAPLGVFAVLGNHDFRAGADRLTRSLRGHGIRVLRNQHSDVREAGTRIHIAGIDDSRQHPNVAKAVGDTSRFTLLLAHNPQELEPAAACGVDLVLSGHTHGGQIRLGIAAPLYQRYLPSGWRRVNGTQMYISRGLGQVIVPVRFGAPPELAVLTLRQGRAGMPSTPAAPAG